MIRGQFSKQEWRPNPDGQTRTIEEALAIARQFGVLIPDDVAFFVDDFGLLDENTTARGPIVKKVAGSPVNWSDFVHNKTGKVPFLIRADIFQSDEAIVAVFAHEMYELESLRRDLQEGKTSIDDYIGHTCAGNAGNLHDEAWDKADALVEHTRKGKKS